MAHHWGLNAQTNDPLNQVITAVEAGRLYGLTRNAIAHAIKRGSLYGRFSGDRWLVTIADLVAYQRGRLPNEIPNELRSSFEQARKIVIEQEDS